MKYPVAYVLVCLSISRLGSAVLRDIHEFNRSNRREARPDNVCAEPASLVCQNFPTLIQNKIIDQITMELEASHTYQAMANFFNRDDVALRGFAKFFQKSSDEERMHGIKFMEYVNKRGGRVSLKSIKEPQSEWPSALAAVRNALQLERTVNDAILDIHWEAQQDNDGHFQDFLESEFVTEQVDSIRQLGEFVTQLERLSDSTLGLHIFDEELYTDKR